jgi:glycosyltransferase involved in cell wall biosynthesis
VAQPVRLPSRILMTADAVGGVWTYALDLVEALAATGMRTVLAVTGPVLAEDRRRADAVPGLTLECGPFPLEWMPQPEAELQRANAWLLGLAARHRPELVHLNGYAPALLSWEAPTVLAAHSCLASWWRAVEGGDPPAEWAPHIDRVARALRCADRVVAPSHAMARMMASVYGDTAERIEVIRNGRDPRALSHTVAKEAFVLAAGRLWDRGKGIDVLDAAARDLDCPVYAAGPLKGPEGSVADIARIHCLGPLREGELAGWMARAGVFCAPARYEPFGLTVLEAALSGAALVLSDIASFRELWEGAAVFVPVGDAERLRRALSELMADEGRRAGLAHAARMRAESYSAAHAARRYAALYAELLARHAKSTPARAAG